MKEQDLEAQIEKSLEPQYETFGVSVDLDQESQRGYLCITFDEPSYPSVSKFVKKMTEELDITNTEVKADYQPERNKFELEVISQPSPLYPVEIE